ncbi:MAG: hypothetical protein FWH48_01255 [Oscillospiraceae bacterium]|nr:hypothetical protein [Oscillospiraceae bacterium]
MNKTDKIYDMADNLDRDFVEKLTGSLNMQKLIDLANQGDDMAQNQTKNKRFVFKRFSFAASVAMFALMFGLLAGIAIAANLLVSRFFPGVGTIDVEPQAVRELAEPVYLENPEIYNVAIDYAAFVRNGNGSGTLFLEWTYLYGAVKYDDYTRDVMRGTIVPDEDWEMPELKNPNPYEFGYSIQPCDAGEPSDNLPCPEMSNLTIELLRKKYDYEAIGNASITSSFDNVEESEYYKIMFDNGQSAVIRLTMLDSEPKQSFWTNEESGFKIRITPYSNDMLRLGYEIFPTEDWSDTVKFTMKAQTLPLLEIEDLRVDDPNGWNTNIVIGTQSQYPDRKQTDPGVVKNSKGFAANIPENKYKDLNGNSLCGYNNFTVNFTGNYKLYIEAWVGTPLREYTEKGGMEYSPEELYTKDDFKARALRFNSVGIDAVFDAKKASRQKVALPVGDGEMELNQEVVMKGLKYYIDRVRREGDRIEIDITTEWNRIARENGQLNMEEYAKLNARVLMSATYGVDKYEYSVEQRGQSINDAHRTVVVLGVGEKVKSLDIYMLWADFDQYGNWVADISHLVD